MFLWHFKPIHLRKIFDEKICLRKKNLVANILCWFVHQIWDSFSPTRPSGPSWSVSCDVYMCVCTHIFHFNFQLFFFEAFHWPSYHMIRSRPLIGHPPPWPRAYYKHTSRELVSPVRGIFTRHSASTKYYAIIKFYIFFLLLNKWKITPNSINI